jgi:hypothetical protein
MPLRPSLCTANRQACKPEIFVSRNQSQRVYWQRTDPRSATPDRQTQSIARRYCKASGPRSTLLLGHAALGGGAILHLFATFCRCLLSRCFPFFRVCVMLPRNHRHMSSPCATHTHNTGISRKINPARASSIPAQGRREGKHAVCGHGEERRYKKSTTEFAKN